MWTFRLYSIHMSTAQEIISSSALFLYEKTTISIKIIVCFHESFYHLIKQYFVVSIDFLKIQYY